MTESYEDSVRRRENAEEGQQCAPCTGACDCKRAVPVYVLIAREANDIGWPGAIRRAEAVVGII